MATRGYLIATDKTQIVRYTNYKDILRLLKCDYLDLVHRFIGNEEYLIWVDDMGRLVDTPRLTAIWKNGQEALYGNILIVKIDEYTGQDIDLTDNDIKNITDNIIEIWYVSNNNILSNKAVVLNNNPIRKPV